MALVSFYSLSSEDKYNSIATKDQNALYFVETGNGVGKLYKGSTFIGSILSKEDVVNALGYTPPKQDTTYSNMVGATTSAAGKAGLVPGPTAGASNRYLRSDGSWQVPPNTTYAVFKAATADAAGGTGLVPAPAKGANNRYLRSDGTWAVPPDNNTTYSTGTASTAGLTKLYTATGSATDGTMTQNAITSALNGKAASSHTHTKSQITDFPTALKNPSALTIQLNGGSTEGTNKFTYDGSAAKGVNITPASIGASASNHTHNYAGSNSAGGIAWNASALYLNPSIRATSADVDLTGNSWINRVTYMLATSSMTTGKPPVDGHILTFGWDTNAGWGGQLAIGDAQNNHLYLRGCSSVDSKATWESSWRTVLDSGNYTSYTVTKTGGGASGTWGISISGSAPTLTTARSINGTNFNGSANITTATWGTARTLTIGNTGKSVNGSGNVSWSLSEIGAAAASHTHSYIPLSGSTAITGNLGMSATSKGYYLKDSSGTQYAGIYDNGSNLWIGSNSGANVGHHVGGTYISAGWSSSEKTTGNTNIYVSVPKYNSSTKAYEHTSYTVLHTGNYTSYTVTKTGSGASGTWGINITGSSASCTGNAKTATQIYGTLTNPTTATIYYIPFHTGASSANKSLLNNNGLQYYTLEGTTSAVGTAQLGLGNSTTSGTAGNKQGKIYMYGTSSGYTTIVPGYNSTSNITITLPSSAGTLALTTSNVASATKLQTARTISLTGSVTGSGTFDGSGNLSIATTTNHTHNYLIVKATNTINSTTNDTTSNWGAHQTSVHWYTTAGYLKDQPSQYGYLLNIGQGSEVHQMWFTQSSGNLAHRGGNSSGWNGSWRTLLDSSNYTGYTVTKTGTGASGTWGINVSGNAAYVKDSNNGTNISITYGKAGQTSTSWLASWNGYELGAISPSNITAGQASKVYGTLTNPSSATTYYIPFHSNASSENKSLCNNNGLWYYTKEGTTSAQGESSLAVGNATNTGTAGNKKGFIRFYSGSTGFGYIYQADTTTNGLYHILPTTSGTILNSGNYNSYAPTKTGGGASGTWGISVTGSAATWTTARTLTIGNTGKSVNGSANVSWSLSEIGAAAASHTHSYLSLDGGTMSGTINSSKTSASYLAGNQGAAIINSTASAGSYTMLAKMNSTSGYFTTGTYQKKYLLQYTASSTVSAGTNHVTKSVTLLDEDGNSSFPGTLTFAGSSTVKYINAARSLYIQNTNTTASQGAIVLKTQGYTAADSAGAFTDGSYYNGAIYFQDKAGNNKVVLGYDANSAYIQFKPAYARTTTSAANVFVNSNGTLARYTSATKYKLDIQSIEDSSYFYNILKVNPKTWFDKDSIEGYVKGLEEENQGGNPEDAIVDFNTISLERAGGLIAEEVEAAGLDRYCHYEIDAKNNKKEIEGIQYDKLATLLIPIVRDLVLALQEVIPLVQDKADLKSLGKLLELRAKFESFDESEIIK